MIGLVMFALDALGPTPNEWGFWLCVVATTTGACLCLIQIEMLFVEYRSDEKTTPSPAQLPFQPVAPQPRAPIHTSSASSTATHRRPVSTHFNHQEAGGWMDLSLDYPAQSRHTIQSERIYDNSRAMTYPYYSREMDG